MHTPTPTPTLTLTLIPTSTLTLPMTLTPVLISAILVICYIEKIEKKIHKVSAG